MTPKEDLREFIYQTILHTDHPMTVWQVAAACGDAKPRDVVRELRKLASQGHLNTGQATVYMVPKADRVTKVAKTQ